MISNAHGMRPRMRPSKKVLKAGKWVAVNVFAFKWTWVNVFRLEWIYSFTKTSSIPSKPGPTWFPNATTISVRFVRNLRRIPEVCVCVCADERLRSDWIRSSASNWERRVFEWDACERWDGQRPSRLSTLMGREGNNNEQSTASGWAWTPAPAPPLAPSVHTWSKCFCGKKTQNKLGKRSRLEHDRFATPL